MEVGEDEVEDVVVVEEASPEAARQEVGHWAGDLAEPVVGASPAVVQQGAVP